VSLLVSYLSRSAYPSSFLWTRMRFSSISPLRFLRYMLFFYSYSSSFAFLSFSLALSALSSRLLSFRSRMDSATRLSSLAFLRSFSYARWDYSNISYSIFSFSRSCLMTSFCFSKLSFMWWYSLSFYLVCLGSLPLRVNYIIRRLFSYMISCCFCISFS
jgi:hypothetical protein